MTNYFRWSQRSLPFLVVALLLLMTSTSSAAASDKIRIRFADEPLSICGVGDVPKVEVFPEDQRAYVRDLFNLVVPEIIKVYGEPLTESPDGVTVTIYYVPTADGSMYLSHKGGTAAKIVYGVVAASLFSAHPSLPGLFACSTFPDIPDHILFLSRAPNDGKGDFDHHFTHEIIHAFHDRMVLLGWYDRSWIEEGMTEATTELVADALFKSGGRDIRGHGINAAPWDNLKHYDMLSYPFNGAWGGNHPGFSILGGIQFFFGGIAVPALGDEHFMNKVIDPKIRYSAATALWLMLTQALSTDSSNPDFLRRLNAQLDKDGIHKMEDDSSETLFKEIEKVAGGVLIEGFPVRDWLLRQAILKGAPSGEDYLFIHVPNPENFRLDIADESQRIIIYAVHKEDLPNPINPLGKLSIGELPAKNCPITVKVIDAYGKVWVEESGHTDDEGKYIVKTMTTLDPGGYAIRAADHSTAFGDKCDRVDEGKGTSSQPGGMSAQTYAMVSGKSIGGPEVTLFGATVRPAEPSFFPGPPPEVKVVGAFAEAAVVKPGFRDLKPSDGKGYFTVVTADPAEPRSFEVDIAQKTPSGGRHRRTIFKPTPYTRVVWLGVSPDFSLAIEPNHDTIKLGKSAEAKVLLIPNGVRRRLGEGDPPECPVRVSRAPGLPAGLTVELEPPFGILLLDESAPDTTVMLMRVKAGLDVKPGTYDIELTALGEVGRDPGTSCSGLVRNAIYKVTIPVPPVPTAGSISGMKFNDLNSNGVNDAEPGLDGWIITLTGPSGTMSTVTSGGGKYKFDGLAAGTYTIGEVLLPGWKQTAPIPLGTYTVTLSPGQIVTGKDFGNKKLSIFGMKFNDKNNNKKRDNGEEGLTGWHIRLVGVDTLTGTPVNKDEITDANGNYGFMDVTPGIYQVFEVIDASKAKAGWVPTTSVTVPVNLKAGESINVNFGNRKIP